TRPVIGQERIRPVMRPFVDTGTNTNDQTDTIWEVDTSSSEPETTMKRHNRLWYFNQNPEQTQDFWTYGTPEPIRNIDQTTESLVLPEETDNSQDQEIYTQE